MAKHRASGDDQLTRQGVIETPGAAYWSVDDSRWRVVRPDLPAHLVDLLAPPIVVGVARVPVTSRLTPPADSTPADGPAPLAVPVLDVQVTPAPSSAAPAVPSPAVPSSPPPALPSSPAPSLPSAAAPAEPAPPPPAPAAPRPVPTPPPNPRPVPAPPHEPRPVPGPPAAPRRNATTGPAASGRRGNGGSAVAGRHRRGASGRAG
ncbi:hypothetical protein GA0070607_3800 [Micromonospora coriariae]|uniref:Uncharacterized protein n=1 Tax=Micromonospora coriariae TaxID=285665 RepID=A0A1C4WKT5_9ACTN|nr:hypothetical protein [Micromonospora coriariae]SCE96835.1 hypothetical protein GA0070607_3800 [Micromonospora coriariae]